MKIPIALTMPRRQPRDNGRRIFGDVSDGFGIALSLSYLPGPAARGEKEQTLGHRESC